MAQPTMKPSTRKLSEVARHVIIPSGIVSTGWPAVEKRCAEFGDEFDEWQRGAGKVALGKRANGEYAATVGGITFSIPRQVAKTFLVMRIIFALCTLFPNLTVLWSAHRTRTSSKTFGSVRGYAGKKAVAPYIESIRSTNGEQEIHFTNGSIIMFGAREQGFGRGFDEVDIEVFDEAQILTEKALEDMVAATNQSRFPAGALLFFMGTPPRPVDPGEAFKARRRDALAIAAAVRAGEDVESDAVYVECSADPDTGSKDGPSLDDREQWAIANPSFPHRTPLRSMLRLRKNLPSDASWRREALGIWDEDQAGSRAITEKQWDELAVDEVPTAGTKAFGVAFSADGLRLALGGALTIDGETHVEIVDAYEGEIEGGLGPLADWFVEKDADGVPRWKRCSVIVLSGRAGASVLEQLLLKRKVPRRRIIVANTSQVFAAAAMLLDDVRAGDVSHLRSEGQAALDGSVAVCDKKSRTKDGAWSWAATTPDGDETPIEAVSFALWGAKTTKRKPSGSPSDGRGKVVVL